MVFSWIFLELLFEVQNFVNAARQISSLQLTPCPSQTPQQDSLARLPSKTPFQDSPARLPSKTPQHDSPARLLSKTHQQDSLVQGVCGVSGVLGVLGISPCTNCTNAENHFSTILHSNQHLYATVCLRHFARTVFLGGEDKLPLQVNIYFWHIW